MRRLITLISAGRNRIVMIRRELPRTRNAGWAEMPYRIKHRRILLSVSLGPVTGAVAVMGVGDVSCKFGADQTAAANDGRDAGPVPAVAAREARQGHRWRNPR